MTAIILDTAHMCNSQPEPDMMVVHGPTWAVTYEWDDESRDLKGILEREGNWRERWIGSSLHMVPSVLRGD